MGIDLCGGDIRMSEHELDGSKIRSVFKKMAGKGMPECMRGYLLADTRLEGIFLDDLKKPLTAHPISEPVGKKKIAPARFQYSGPVMR